MEEALQEPEIITEPPKADRAEVLERQLYVLSQLYRLQKEQQEEQKLALERIEASLDSLSDEVGYMSRVEVSDVNISFGSMLSLMVKSFFASLLAVIVIGMIGFLGVGLLSLIGVALFR